MIDTTLVKEIEIAITTIGFPIFMCWLMWKKITESDAKQSELLGKLIGAINELTVYIRGRKKEDE